LVRKFFLGNKPDGRIKIIQQRVQMLVYVKEGFEGFLPLKTGITDCFPHNIAFFLFNETVTVFAVGSASGELDVVPGAPIKQLTVNELAPVAAVDAEHGEKQIFPSISDLLCDPAAGVVQQGAFLSSAVTDIGDGQSLAESA
jgi:hypothetical protein